MNRSDLERLALFLFPGGEVETDNYGQLIIYTGKAENPDGSLRDFSLDDGVDVEYDHGGEG